MFTRSRMLVAGVAAIGLLLTGCATKEAGSAAPAGAAGRSAGVTDGAAASAAGTPSSAGSDTGSAGGATSSKGQAAGGKASSVAQPTSGGSAASGDADAFAQKIAQGMASVKSLQGTMTLDGAISGSGTVKETLESGKLKAADIDMKLTAGGQNLPIKMLLIDGKAYFGGQLVTMLGTKTQGKEWIALDPNSSDPTLAQMGKQLGSISSMGNMADQYVLMAKALKSVETVGTEQVAGVSTTHYKTVVDVQKMASILPPEMKDSASQIEQSGMKELPVDYWLDDQGRMVQFKQSVEAMGQKLATSMTIDKYDAPLTIEAPDPSTVYTG